MEALLAHGPFAEFALLLIISAVVGAIAVSLRQPLLISYIVVGILLGPAVFGPVNAADQIHLLAEIGVAVLLFVVGLKLDLAHIRNIGPVALATGLGQLTFTIIFGFALTLLMGKSAMEAIYIAVALTFSSTIIIVKLLSDKQELDSLHGRIAVGFLIVQDLAVVLAMMTMSALRGAGDAGWAEVSGSLLLRLGGAAVLLYLLMRYVLPDLVSRMARSQELLLIFAIAWGTGLAALGDYVGFSKEAGAFVAGFSLASTAYREAMNARLTGIRDFMLLFFFIDLGGKLDFSTLGNELLPALVLALFVLIGNPLIVMAIMGYMGYRKRTGFLAGLTVAQISEFSIVFVAMGISLGHVGPQALGLTTQVGLVTIMLAIVSWRWKRRVVPRGSRASSSSAWAAMARACCNSWPPGACRCWAWTSIRKRCARCAVPGCRYASAMARTRAFSSRCPCSMPNGWSPAFRNGSPIAPSFTRSSMPASPARSPAWCATTSTARHWTRPASRGCSIRSPMRQTTPHAACSKSWAANGPADCSDRRCGR